MLKLKNEKETGMEDGENGKREFDERDLQEFEKLFDEKPNEDGKTGCEGGQG